MDKEKRNKDEESGARSQGRVVRGKKLRRVRKVKHERESFGCSFRFVDNIILALTTLRIRKMTAGPRPSQPPNDSQEHIPNDQ